MSGDGNNLLIEPLSPDVVRDLRGALEIVAVEVDIDPERILGPRSDITTAVFVFNTGIDYSLAAVSGWLSDNRAALGLDHFEVLSEIGRWSTPSSYLIDREAAGWRHNILFAARSGSGEYCRVDIDWGRYDRSVT